jgi:DUF4097 and DUF4098 domain-containing protein YvlB
MNKTLWLPALLALTALPLAAQQRRDRDEEYVSGLDTTIAFDRRGTVALTIGSGEIVVSAWDRPQVRVHARSERGIIRFDATAARLTLDLSRRSGGDTRFEVTVPQGVSVNARSTNGDVTITGTKGPVEVSTQNGDIRVQDVLNVDVNAFSGDLDVRGVNGNVEVNALSGDIVLSDVRGEVEAVAVSGDIELRGIIAKFVRAKSTSGDIDFDGAVEPAGRYELGSHSGTVTLVIPRATGALLTVSTYTGSIDSDFPITLRPGEHGIGHPRSFTFEVGKGDARISAESFSGDINVRVKGAPTTDR